RGVRPRHRAGRSRPNLVAIDPDLKGPSAGLYLPGRLHRDSPCFPVFPSCKAGAGPRFLYFTALLAAAKKNPAKIPLASPHMIRYGRHPCCAFSTYEGIARAVVPAGWKTTLEARSDLGKPGRPGKLRLRRLLG